MLISSVWRERSTAYFSLGLVIGGATVSAVLSLLSEVFIKPWMTPNIATVAVTAVLVAVALHELKALKLPLPQNARQVPERVVEAGPRFGALQFGVEMGTGMRTFVTSAQPYLLLALILVGATPLQAVVAGIGFGLGRSLVPVARQATDLHQDWSAAFEDKYQLIRLVTLAAMISQLPLLLST